MIDATDRQLDVLRFIRGFMREHGYPPTLREICRGLGVGSTNCVSGHLYCLARKGYLERDTGTARGIRITAKGEAA